MVYHNEEREQSCRRETEPEYEEAHIELHNSIIEALIHNRFVGTMDSTSNNASFSPLPTSLAAAVDDDNFLPMESLPDPDEGFVLFPDEDNQEFTSSEEHEFHAGVTKKKSPQCPEEAEHILGTVIVRVVAARGLVNPNPNENGFGGVFRNTAASAAVNPYASVKFGKTTQRTSDVYCTVNPVWPRDEVFFMDVSLPVSQLTHSPDSSSLSEEAASSSSSSSPNEQTKDDATALLEDPYYGYTKPDNTTLTVAIFHSDTENAKRQQKNFAAKNNISGDSDDVFLGMASIDLTRLFTGKVPELDEWLPLSGSRSYNDGHRNVDVKEGRRVASVRIMCEYEASDVPPKAGDICRFTRFSHPKDLYPLEPARSYKVDQVHDNGDVVHLSYESPEGWLLSFQAHKNMLICEERHFSALNTAQDELQTLGERLSVSPLVVTVTETAGRIVDDGMVGIAEGMIKGSINVFDRWFRGGVDMVIRDLQDVTNLDGRHNVDSVGQHLDLESPTSSSDSLADENTQNEVSSPFALPPEAKALPNMPACPITGFPMVDPVVAADGHTYERSAISRWLKTSNKSPMTGSVLFHKELVPNYGLLSSIQEATAREKEETIYFSNEDE